MSQSERLRAMEPAVRERKRAAADATNDSGVSIVIHNDDVTPYDYVIEILGTVFLLSEELADHIAWTAHTKGQAVVVVRPREEAQKLVSVAHGRARLDGYPLTFSLETE